MPQILTIDTSVDSKTETISTEADFVRLVDEYMGADARNYHENLIEHKDELIAELKEELHAWEVWDK